MKRLRPVNPHNSIDMEGDQVSDTILNPLLSQPRIINFSGVEIDSPLLLQVELESERLVETIRLYGDRPFVYIVASGQEALVTETLESLAKIRSTCYPHALFVLSGDYSKMADDDLQVISIETTQPEDILQAVEDFCRQRFSFDLNGLDNQNQNALPEKTEVLIVGGGITGLYGAHRLRAAGVLCHVVEARDIVGGIWSQYANATSQVNTSEGAYRLIEREVRANRDHSTTAEILRDMSIIVAQIKDNLFTRTRATRIEGSSGAYTVTVEREGSSHTIACKGVILAINDRIGPPREITWRNQDQFNGLVCQGISDQARDVDWQGKKVAVIGMGAFAVENVRTALENGAEHVTVVCRRHGTVCPKIIDYLNFATPYDENFLHDRKSNIRNMMLWKKLYDLSGATQPECWMGKIKHEGHTISVSDIWFIAHFLGKLATQSGTVTGLYDHGLVVDYDTRIEADVIVNCVGFHRNSPVVKQLCGRDTMYNNNYIDKDLMYLADAYIDDDVFNSFFGSSVLEMTKFYMDVFIHFFNNQEFETMINSAGIGQIDINDRRWSHYIAGAESLIRNYPTFDDAARKQIDKRTANFLEAHDLETYVAANRREWHDLHEMLSGRRMKEAECLPYVFDKLVG